MPKKARSIKKYGNNTRNQDKYVNPLSHKHERIKVQTRAKMNLMIRKTRLKCLKSANNMEIIAITK